MTTIDKLVTAGLTKFIVVHHDLTTIKGRSSAFQISIETAGLYMTPLEDVGYILEKSYYRKGIKYLMYDSILDWEVELVEDLS